MPRCKKKRCCRQLDGERCLKPSGIPRMELEMVELGLDEFEAIRLCDFDGKVRSKQVTRWVYRGERFNAYYSRVGIRLWMHYCIPKGF